MSDTFTKPLVDAETESIIARTALKYDLLPYASNPFPQSQPGRLAAVARIFGLDSVPLAEARVLELGCAAGGNIIPLAHRNPTARFIGIDLSRTQVAAGRSRIAGLGLTNIEIRCQSFTEIGSDVGKFDYIICHGVYSWVPAPVRVAILRIVNERLSERGIAYVSYNVLPGWRMLQAMRDIFLLHVPDSIAAPTRVTAARDLLSHLSGASRDAGPYKQVLAEWSLRLRDLPDDYIAHEFLEEINEPCTVSEFVGLAERHDLSYLGEVEISSMILDNQGAEAAVYIRERTGNNLLANEQMLDSLTGRTFRQSLLVSADRGARILRDLDVGRTSGLHFTCSGEVKAEAAEKGGKLSDPYGRSLATTSSPVFSCLQEFVRRFPASSCLDELIGAVPVAEQETVRNGLADALFKMVLVGMAAATAEKVAAKPAGEYPLACPLVRADVERGEAATTNLRHERVVIDPAARTVLPLMDGRHGIDDLARQLAKVAQAGKLTFNRDGRPVTGMAAIQDLANDFIHDTLAGIARSALLVG